MQQTNNQLQKRYQYWGLENGKPKVKWTEWFPYQGPRELRQSANRLLNEYREV